MNSLVAFGPVPSDAAAYRPWPPLLVDTTVMAAALAGSLALLAHDGDLDAAKVSLVAAASVPLLGWRHHPWGVFTLTASASVLLAVVGSVLWPPVGPAAALYLLASSRDDTTPWTPRSVGVIGALLLAYLGAAVAATGYVGTDIVHAGLAFAAAWFAGERTRLRREHLADLRRRATRTEQDATRERQLAIAEERARIARDLHDSAGHALNLIAVRAGAARLRQDPERSAAALAAIEDIARRTVADIDQFVGSLRTAGTDESKVETPAGLSSVDSLIADHRASGLAVSIERSGIARPVSSAVDQAAYRILQESLTNAARHGAGAAHVRLDIDESALHLGVENPVAETARGSSGRAHGLVGMRERASLLGGELTAEQAGHVFRIRARLPEPGRRP